MLTWHCTSVSGDLDGEIRPGSTRAALLKLRGHPAWDTSPEGGSLHNRRHLTFADGPPGLRPTPPAPIDTGPRAAPSGP